MGYRHENGCCFQQVHMDIHRNIFLSTLYMHGAGLLYPHSLRGTAQHLHPYQGTQTRSSWVFLAIIPSTTHRLPLAKSLLRVKQPQQEHMADFEISHFLAEVSPSNLFVPLLLQGGCSSLVTSFAGNCHLFTFLFPSATKGCIIQHQSASK